ncbi:Serine/threonine protein phosphatase PrpC [Microlunatus sagamiharensis]|uniref:Serine/threonine protein phosphatase PrpC n=1 Tax=Microlunatus sagamiharensis TaxID=546874 RepID=A0A1H2MD77_9ACTN|nr:protein phosphatase 2C domain-containing protein [Microlunatus sagamiharensis]SDU91024.1 Serine/threonine protein phosphatase PrpC [Microlunatus sagamiharensis]
MTDAPPLATATVRSCPGCGAPVEPEQAFCESCGSPLLGDGAGALPAVGTGSGVTAVAQETPVELTRPTTAAGPEGPDDHVAGPDDLVPASRCLSCGGEVGEDSYCTVCGTKAPIPRDHYVEQPATWVAAVCDRGVKHHRNEDATAVAADPDPGSRAVLVVCDGVSSAPDSDVAALAAARRARDVLTEARPVGLPNPASRAGLIADAFEDAVAQADQAVLATTPVEGPSAAACTFAGAVVEGDLVVFGNVGDSRVYWLPDPGGSGPGSEPAELSLDDSMAQARIAMGVDRETAENGPQAHAITKWLGRDSPDVVPRTGSVVLGHPGWLLVCSDGLWNYCSEAGRLGELVGSLSTDVTSPLELAEALVRWANEQGGRDNVSVALARH